MRALVGVAVALLAAMAITTSAVAADALATGGPPPSLYQDPLNDAGTGPDLGDITVSNDNHGTLTFRMDIGNRTSLTPEFALDIWIDGDSNPARGDARVGGVEWDIFYLAGQIVLSHWNGSDWDLVATPPSLKAVFSNGVTITINAADLGGTAAFNFWIGTWDSFTDQNNWDNAPIFGTY